jgi:uncharacterized protein YndB with AHSA1/START domain
MSAPSSTQALADREIVVSRTIDAPRSLVFEAFTDLDHLNEWWGPRGTAVTTSAFEFRPGGVWEGTIQSPGGGGEFPNHIVWKEIVKPERIVWLYGMADDTVETTVTLDDRGSSTEITLRLVFGSKEQREQAEKYNAAGGAKQTLDRLAAAVTSHVEGGQTR